MWYHEYKDYPPDTPLIQEQVSSGKGIIGCEMHELNGWGEAYHRPLKKKRGLIETLLGFFFSSNDDKGDSLS